jgi:hypothetical protein
LKHKATVRKNCRPARSFSMSLRIATSLPFDFHKAPAPISEGAGFGC